MAEEGKKVLISDDCIGCGACADHTVKEGDLFDVSSGKSEFIYEGEMTDEVVETVQAAIDACPVQAISME